MHCSLLILMFWAVSSLSFLQPPYWPRRARLRIANAGMVKNGARVDFSYNQSRPVYGYLKSVPGCPRSDAGYPWLYYHDPAVGYDKCYLVGQKGPCKQGQKFVMQLHSAYGFCNCDCFDDIDIFKGETTEKFCVGEDRTEHAFLPRLKQCFELYGQGPCNEGEWLVKYSEMNSITLQASYRTKCERRICPRGQVPASSPDLSCAVPTTPFSIPGGIIWKGMMDCLNGRYSALLRKCVKRLKPPHIG